MGTRSTITFYQDDQFVCCIYQQFDGDLFGVGEELKQFLKSKKFANGIFADKNVFNGPGCFIAQFIKEFKTRAGGAGGLYLFPEGAKEQYNYRVDFWERDIDNYHLEIIIQVDGDDLSDDEKNYYERIIL